MPAWRAYHTDYAAQRVVKAHLLMLCSWSAGSDCEMAVWKAAVDRPSCQTVHVSRYLHQCALHKGTQTRKLALCSTFLKVKHCWKVCERRARKTRSTGPRESPEHAQGSSRTLTMFREIDSRLKYLPRT